MADTEAADGPIFRANKRRKVLRKRAGTQEEDPASGGNYNRRDDTLDLDGGQDEVSESPSRSQPKPGPRRKGIAFSSNASARGEAQGGGQIETSLVVRSELDNAALEDIQSNRFVKPTGKLDVMEDKHMTAYVDLKLAEMRTAAVTAAAVTAKAESRLEDNLISHRASEEIDMGRAAQTIAITPIGGPGRRALPPMHNIHASQRATRKARRQKVRDEADLVRDSYIDEFMHESQVPLYDRAIVEAASSTKHQGAAGLEDEGEDNDMATAQAFKAQLLADIEKYRRRKPPVPSSSVAAGKGAVPASSGPKLGGSRAQRERMRAMEEAKGKK